MNTMRAGTMLVVLSLMVVPLLHPPSAGGPVTRWSGFRGDEARAGWITGPAPSSNDTLWTFDTGGPVQSSPVLGGGLLFAGSDSGRVFALSPATGKEAWNRSFGEFATVQSTPYYDSGVLYIGSQNGSKSGLYALNASDGKVIWEVPDDSGIASSPLFYAGTVYYGSLNGSIAAVNATTGALVWTNTRGGEVWSSPALANGTLFGGTIKGELFALWAANGTVRWNTTYPSGWTVYSSPAVATGIVYFGMADYSTGRGEVVALEASSGAVRWRFTGSEGVYSSPAVAGDTVYAHVWNKTAKGGYLLALPTEDPDGSGLLAPGEVVWSFQTYDFEGGSSPIVADNLVVVGSTDGNLYAVDRAGGKEAWRVRTDEKIVGSPAIDGRKVYAGSMDGKVYAVGSASELPGMRVEITPERVTLPGGTVTRVGLRVVDDAGNPVEGAFVSLKVTAGNLSQSGASTFPDGSQSVKYMAPLAKSPQTVTLTAMAARGGYAPATNTTTLTTTVYTSAYSGVKSQSSFNMGKYLPYMAVLALVGAADAALFGLLLKRGWVRLRRRGG